MPGSGSRARLWNGLQEVIPRPACPARAGLAADPYMDAVSVPISLRVFMLNYLY